MPKKKTQRKDASKSRTKVPSKQSKTNGQTLRKAVDWVLNGISFQHLKQHGNIRWDFRALILLTTFWVWSGESTLTGAFTAAQKLSVNVLGHAAVGNYQALTNALARWTADLLPLLWTRLQSLMQQLGGDHGRIAGWWLLAVDGSRISVPRTAANELAFCARNYGGSGSAKSRRKKRAKSAKKKRGQRHLPHKKQPVRPQIWVTLLWQMGLRLPWCWKTGPSYASERGHLQELLKTQTFPEKTLITGDAGFVGFDFWNAIQNHGHKFLMRVGANVTLVRKLGYVRESAGIMYCWPDKVSKKQKIAPLALRLISLRLGKTPVYLVTNILDPNELSDADACRLYQLRWGIELEFRAFKQTFGRAKLRSRTPDRALVELDWSLLGLWMIQLFAMKEQIKLGEPPEHSSAAGAIKVIRDAMRDWHETPSPSASVSPKLGQAVKDQYERTKASKRARYRPYNKKDMPAAGKPNIVTANATHRKRLQQYLASAT